MDRRISKDEDRSNEITQSGEQKEKRMKKSRASKACETLSKTKIHPMGISEKRRKPTGQKGHLKKSQNLHKFYEKILIYTYKKLNEFQVK